MLQEFQRGHDLLPFVKAIRTAGGNGARVLTQFSWLNDPLQPVAPDVIAAFCKWMRAQGMYVGLVIGADCATYDPAREGRTGFGQNLAALITRTADVLGHVAGMVNVQVEDCNEPGKNLPADCHNVWQVVTALGLQDPRNRPVLMGTGDYDIVGQETTFDALDFMYDHGPRKPDWPGEAGKLGHFVTDGWGGTPSWPGFKGRNVHVFEDEPIGCAEVASGSRDTNPDNHEDGGGGYAMGNGSVTFHWQCGIDAVLPGSVQQECSARFFAAADFFPPDACTGKYTHNSFADFPLVSFSGDRPDLASEVAGRLMPDGHTAYVVAAQATDKWLNQYRVTQNGWRIVREAGHHWNLLELRR
jgi:hypothetical protein